MRALDVVKMPLYVAQVATGAKSFRDNPVLGSRRLNERGLHVRRVALAQKMSDWRRSRLAGLLPAEERALFAQNGYIERRDMLAPALFERLKEEIGTARLDAWEMLQGNAVTRFMPLPPEVLRNMPALRAFVTGPEFLNPLRYVASTCAEPILYLSAVLTDPQRGEPDPQTTFHSDTFFPNAKAWFFLDDVEADSGPFCYVPGSHRLTAERRVCEQSESVTAATHANRLHGRGSFRISEDELALRGFAAPVHFAVPGNTLVVADTFGFHARAASVRPTVRIAVYGGVRRNPFLPITGLDPLSVPGLRGRMAQMLHGYQDTVARLTGKRPSQRYVGKVSLAEPARI